MNDFADSNEAAVASILDAYDEFVERAEAYQSMLEDQLAVADTNDVVYVSRLKSSLNAVAALSNRLEEASGGFSDPDAGVLDALMELKHGQHHIRLAREGRMV